MSFCQVEGMPLDRYLDHFTGLNRQEAHEVIGRVMEEANGAASASASASGVCTRRRARVGLLSWNVGGISDHRKDQGAGLEEAAQAAVQEVLQAAVQCIGEAEIVVVGLQEGRSEGLRLIERPREGLAERSVERLLAWEGPFQRLESWRRLEE